MNTPTPWKSDGTDICQNNNRHFHVIANVKLFKDYDADDIRNKQSSPNQHQYLVEMNCPIDGDEKANAEYIVKCVNSHDALLEAAKDFMSYLKNGKLWHHESRVDLIERFEKAIQKAEGEND